ncbi:hypothetical protein Taro_015568 [Colocasia esculenta]|uniref:Retrotransposon gag domain-containing protein n=1 Tax=Colocasia esculenta TaxID=4460 RepID=A0A843UL66_COLES|nr:hypothetical protein [Colocasia esculenta]
MALSSGCRNKNGRVGRQERTALTHPGQPPRLLFPIFEDVFVLLGARRRWSFLREGPNGLALHVEPFWVSGSVGGDRENQVLGVGRGSGSRGRYSWRRQARELIEQQDESDMPAQGQVEEEVSAEESFFRNMYQGAWQPGQAAASGQPPIPPPAVPEQQAEPEVRLVVYQLKGAAHEWWRVQRQTHFQGQQLDQITWQWFLEIFHGEYFPDYARRERRDMFYELVQGDLTISQYHQRSVQLLRHVPHVTGSEQACAERFITRLRPDLRWGVTADMCTTLGEAVAKATTLERETWQPQQQQQ